MKSTYNLVFLVFIVLVIATAASVYYSKKELFMGGCPCGPICRCGCRRMRKEYPACPYSYAKQNCGWGHRGAWWQNF